MRTVEMPNTDMQVTPIAYGCMPLGRGWGDEPITDEIQQAADLALDQAIASGINYFDHADIYCAGKSEKVFGTWLQQHPSLRKDIYIQSKCGIRPSAGSKPQQFDFSYEHITRSVDQSIENLRCDYLDTLVLHRPDVLMDPFEVAAAFKQLHKDGRVRYFGVSNQPCAKINLLQSALDAPLICNQIQLSILHHLAISSGVDWNIYDRFFNHEGILEYCQQHQICVQAWSPLAKGFLDDRVASDEHPEKEHIDKVQTEIKIIANGHQCSPGAIALAWLMRIPGFVQPIIGTTNPERIKAAAQAADVTLSRDDWYRLFLAGRDQRLP